MTSERLTKSSKSEYPRLEELKIPIRKDRRGPAGVGSEDLDAGLRRAGLSLKTFAQLFGCQTAGENGLYPWDVEAVLERMMSGKLTGTQLLWDSLILGLSFFWTTN